MSGSRSSGCNGAANRASSARTDSGNLIGVIWSVGVIPAREQLADHAVGGLAIITRHMPEHEPLDAAREELAAAIGNGDLLQHGEDRFPVLIGNSSRHVLSSIVNSSVTPA